jgi:septal ring factor EnvC (AmiA/AmiB activator)
MLLILPLVLLGYQKIAFAGSIKPLISFDQVEGDLEKGLENLKKEFEQFSGDITESEEFKKLKKELDRLAEELKRVGESAREKIEKELLPRLKEEIEKLRKRLQELGREEAVEPLEI